MALVLLCIAFVECDHTLVITLITLGYGLGGLSVAGCYVTSLDYAPKYAGNSSQLCS